MTKDKRDDLISKSLETYMCCTVPIVKFMVSCGYSKYTTFSDIFRTNRLQWVIEQGILFIKQDSKHIYIRMIGDEDNENRNT